MIKKTLLTALLILGCLLGAGELRGQESVYTIGSGSSTTFYIPLRTNSKYSYSEQIYTATELTNAGCTEGSITKIAFKMTSDASFNRKLDIYMKATTKASFNSNSAVNVLSSDLVYSSGENTVSFSQNVWTEITLNNPFAWDGVSNIMIMIYDKTGSSESSSYSFNYYSSTDGSLYYTSTNAISNITSLPSGTRNNGKNVVQLTIEATSTPRPKNLAFSNIGANTATVSWTSPSNAVIDYTYQYQLSGGDWSSPIGENTISGTAANLSGLTAKRSYDVRIRANYENSQTSEWVTKSFNTAVNLPYSYGFEDASELNFWTLKDANASTNIENGNAHQGSKSFKFFGSGSNQYLISPILVTASSGVHVEFYYKISNSSYSQKLKVGYSTSDINSFTFSDDVITVNSTSYPNESVKFDFPYDNIKYIAIQFDRNSNYQSTYIDDISISTCTTCVSPSDVTCTAVSATSATLGWTSNVGSYEIYITDDENDVPDSNSTTDITSNTESKTIYGLSAGTTYYAYVRACCDEESKSDWSSVCQFTPTVSQSTTVNNVGTETTNNHVPFYGNYASKTDTQGQYIIPASALSALANGQITKLAVYGTANQSFTSTFKVHLAEVSQTTLSSIYTGDMVEVYSGTLATDASGLMEIEFSTPYNYNGNNLLVDFIITTAGNNPTTTWVGITTTENTAYYQYKGALDVIYAYGEKHLPKTTLTYIPSIEFNSDGNWNTATNWEINTLPATTYNVTIDAACTIPSGCDAEVNNIIINSGESLTVASGGSLTLNGTMTVEGTMTINGTFNYSEEPEDLIIEDGGQLIINKSAGKDGGSGVIATVKKEIEGFGENPAVKTGWYTIASPLVSTISHEGSMMLYMLTETYDLYYYEEENMFWRNYRVTPFNIAPEKGYLYANSSNKTLSFEGEIQYSDASISNELSYAATETKVKGFNLVGNPFTCNISSGVKLGGSNLSTYYIADGSADGEGRNIKVCTLGDRPIKPCEGFIVQATSTGQSIVFNSAKKGESSNKPSFICIEAGNADFMDRAYVQFGNANTLRKMSISDETPQVYVVYDGKDYAAATITEMQGQIPVNFVAAKNGQYTIKVKTDNLETSYLHLIDNLTGANIDLLQTPSYTFQGNTTDISARFRLMFTTTGVDENADEGQTDFAFISDGQLIVNGNGTLYIYDALGRQISVKQVSPLTSPGLYLLQLVEGNSVRTQKIIVK